MENNKGDITVSIEHSESEVKLKMSLEGYISLGCIDATIEALGDARKKLEKEIDEDETLEDEILRELKRLVFN